MTVLNLQNEEMLPFFYAAERRVSLLSAIFFG